MEKILQADFNGAEARLPRWMMAFAVAGAIALLVLAGPRAAAGFVLGAGIAILNYRWLHQAITLVLDLGRSRPSRWMAVKFLVRYPLVFAGVYIFYRNGWLPILPLLGGLFVPVTGALAECVVQLCAGPQGASLESK